MKIITANRLSDGRVIYWDTDGQPTAEFDKALKIEAEAAEALLAKASVRTEIFVNPYLTDVVHGVPSGRDRLKESIRSKGPTVGHSLKAPVPAPVPAEVA
jgi:hypothetical protein